MTFSELRSQTRRWHGLVLGALVAAMMHLSGATNAAREAEPWPELLSAEAAAADADVALLHRRAADSLERLDHATPQVAVTDH